MKRGGEQLDMNWLKWSLLYVSDFETSCPSKKVSLTYIQNLVGSLKANLKFQ